MRKFGIVIAIAAAIGLAACSQSQLTGAGSDVVAAALPPAQLASLQKTCASVAPDLTTATSPAVPNSVSQVATYASAFCQQITTGNTANVDTNSPSWLTTVLSEVSTAAQTAGVLLPLISAL